MASASGPPDSYERHQDFYSQWIATQEQHLQELQAAIESDMKEADLARLVTRAREHYRAYYEVKESFAKRDVLEVMSPSWMSPFENAFLWLGGLRPTMAVNLAYAEAARQLEIELPDILEGVDTPSMAAMSFEQLGKINDLQTKTLERERELTQRMAVLQREIADNPSPTLATESLQREESKTVEAVVTGKLKSLENLLIDADITRYETLDQILKVLSVFQSAQYLVAAGYLQICIRRIGKSLILGL